MSVRFHIPAVLRRYSRDEAELELSGVTVGAALAHLFERHPGLEPRVLNERGELYPYLLLFRNGAELSRTGLKEVELAAGDVLELLGAAEGGAPEGAPQDVRMRGFRTRATVEEARAAALRELPDLGAERAPLERAAGRVLAEPAVSAVDVPPFRRSAMDGYAVVAADTFGASLYDPVRLRVVGEVLPGDASPPPIAPGEACRIMTGARVPEGADAVLMAEDASVEDGAVLVRAPIPAAKNVGRVGEDVERESTVLRAGRRLRPQDVGLLASIGFGDAPVRRRPRVRILVTGDELLPPGEAPREGAIVDSNTPMLRGLVERDGGVVADAQRLADDREAIRAAMQTSDVDVLLAAGGTSVGAEDHLPTLVAELGSLDVHGIAMRPSSPTGLGRIGAVRVVLLPGNPVSCLCAYDFFGGPLVRALGGRDRDWPYERDTLPLARRIASRVGRLDYVRVRVNDGRVEPLAVSGASILSSTTRADGFVLIPADSEGHAEGERVEVHLYDRVRR
ncbi:MAG: gephyrin-like molybdotransferase Glp [Planctomycetota bacterium]